MKFVFICKYVKTPRTVVTPGGDGQGRNGMVRNETGRGVHCNPIQPGF